MLSPFCLGPAPTPHPQERALGRHSVPLLPYHTCLAKDTRGCELCPTHTPGVGLFQVPDYTRGRLQAQVHPWNFLLPCTFLGASFGLRGKECLCLCAKRTYTCTISQQGFRLRDSSKRKTSLLPFYRRGSLFRDLKQLLQGPTAVWCRAGPCDARLSTLALQLRLV